jgi:hypothetical protein
MVLASAPAAPWFSLVRPPRAALENGCITIEIPCDQVVAGYIELVAKQQSSDENEGEVHRGAARSKRRLSCPACTR